MSAENYCKSKKSYQSEELQNTDSDGPITTWEYLKILLNDFSISYKKKLTKYIKQKANEFFEAQIKLLEVKPYTEINMHYKRLLEKRDREVLITEMHRRLRKI